MADFLFPGESLSAEGLTSAYIAAKADMGNDDLAWASLHVSNLVFSGRPEEGWDVIAAATRAVTDPTVLCQIGAGELEDLIVNHGAELIEAIEAEAASNDNLRKALACVWGGDPEVRARVDALLTNEEG